MGKPEYFVRQGSVYCAHGKLDCWSWRWQPEDRPEDAEAVDPYTAMMCLKAHEDRRRIPIGIIGPRDATPEQLDGAVAVGRAVGELGLTMICGGKGGVMNAAAEGCRKVGGLTVGLLPDHDWRLANPHIELPIATGLSEARNMIIAKSCAVLIAVGGSYGTLTEIAYGLHFSKPVIGLLGAPEVEGLERADSPDDAVNRMAGHLLASAVLS